MEGLFRPLLLLLIFASFGGGHIFAQGQCSFTINMSNNNRYAYDTAEECLNCGPFCHSVPFGNWGVSSNVGSKQNANQFEGWNPGCSYSTPRAQVQWNSCSVDYVKPDPDCQRLNFPDHAAFFPYPSNGYPFTDPFLYNNSVPPYGNSRCVDQYSPCGPNIYGTASVTVGVSAQVDIDQDGIADAGGCMDLQGYYAGVENNFMTIYELDEPDPDDLVESLYFPNSYTQLTCTPDACFSVADLNFDGWIDDMSDHTQPENLWPILYQDNNGAICYPTDPNVPCKRIDATIRVGRVVSFYSGPTPGSCDPYAQQQCYNQGGSWDFNTCTCNCIYSSGCHMY